jgi:hypothetical protein
VRVSPAREFSGMPCWTVAWAFVHAND